MKALTLAVPIAFAAGLALSLPSFAQQAPAGSTGLCKDGTYTTTQTKRGACHGHGGVKDWYGTSGTSGTTAKNESKSGKAASTAGASTPATTTAPTEPAPKTASSTKTSSKGMRAQAAPGGGAGKVWLNTSTNVYHCQGDEWYGKTKAGEYVSESDAKAKGARAARGKACG